MQLNPLRAAFYTLGCRLNQCETEAIADGFSRYGIDVVPIEQKADIYLFNTCTVTSKSEQKARRMIRKIANDENDAVIIATGCYAQMSPSELDPLADQLITISLDHKDALIDLAPILLNQSKDSLFAKLVEWKAALPSIEKAGSNRFKFEASDFSFHSRPFLKIEDGCNRECSYCRVTLARGSAVSLHYKEVLRRAQALESKGYHEVILTGVNLDSYSSDGYRLPQLIDLLLKESNNIRFRLSSLEPESLTDEFAKIVEHPRITPYFHIAVQSGSDKILKLMKRPYKRDVVYDGIKKIRQVKNDPFIGADIIAGFPTENNDDFKDTTELIKDLDLAWAHIFPYSSRPGTTAAKIKPVVDSKTIKERCSKLAEIISRHNDNYIKRQNGREVSLIIEKIGNDGFTGVSENYINSFVQTENLENYNKGDLIKVKLTNKTHNNRLLGKIS